MGNRIAPPIEIGSPVSRDRGRCCAESQWGPQIRLNGSSRCGTPSRVNGLVEPAAISRHIQGVRCACSRPLGGLEIVFPSQPAMPAQAKRASAHRAAKSPAGPRLGSLPEWNLADLYAGLDEPQVKRDLERGAGESLAFEREYKGKLA